MEILYNVLLLLPISDVMTLNKTGPVSTTTDFTIAKGFAGKNGKILELYPSFGKKGLKVSWLSNFPDECEVIYMNTFFQTSNVITITASSSDRAPQLNSKNTDPNDEEALFHSMTRCILNAIQTINVNSKIISLNDEEEKSNVNNYKNINDVSLFGSLKNYEKLSVLYLLYIQYKPGAWKKLTSEQNQKSHFINAIMEFRDQFITLATNVRAVSMDNMSKLLEMFFYSNPKKYQPPELKDDNDFTQVDDEVERNYKANQPFYFSTIVKLFPQAQQISISAKNFDWSLTKLFQERTIFFLYFCTINTKNIYKPVMY